MPKRIKKPQATAAATRKGRRAARGWDSSLGAARGELLLVEYAVNKAAKELRTLANRVERIGQCAREAGERINPIRSPNAALNGVERKP